MFKKIFIFDELNYFLLINAIILRILRQKVYFLRLKKVWQNEKSIKILKFLGLNWLNFQDYEIKKTAEISRDVVSLQNKLGNYVLLNNQSLQLLMLKLNQQIDQYLQIK